LDDALSTLDDLYEATLKPDGGFRSEQMEAIAKLAEEAMGCVLSVLNPEMYDAVQRDCPGKSLGPEARRFGFKGSAMWHDVVWIGGAWIVAAIGAWLVCRARGYTVAAWVAPLTISVFCLGLYLGIENSAKGRFRLPFVHSPHRSHLAHHAGR
jgi:hypothetical protein